MNVLHIDSSALGAYSLSRQLTADIVAQLGQQFPSSTIQYRDLTAEALAHWTPTMDASDPATQINQQMMDEFLAAEVVVIGAPMYNFSVSSQLKAWIDRILVAGKTFRYTENGPEGLVRGKRVIIASSRGGRYGPGSVAQAMDFQEPYLRAALGFIGIDDIEFVRAEGVAQSEARKDAAMHEARESIGVALHKAA